MLRRKQVEVHCHHRSQRLRRKQVEVHRHHRSQRLWRKTGGGPPPPPFTETEEKIGGGKLPLPPPIREIEEKKVGGPPPPQFSEAEEKTSGGPPPPAFTEAMEKTERLRRKQVEVHCHHCSQGLKRKPVQVHLHHRSQGLRRKPVQVDLHHRSQRLRRKQVDAHHHQLSHRLWRKQVEVPLPPPFREAEEKTGGGPSPPPFREIEEKTDVGPPPPPFTKTKVKTGGGPPPPQFREAEEKTGGGPPPPAFTEIEVKTGGGPLPPLLRRKQVEVNYHYHHRSERLRRKQVEVHCHHCSQGLKRKPVQVHLHHRSQGLRRKPVQVDLHHRSQRLRRKQVDAHHHQLSHRPWRKQVEVPLPPPFREAEEKTGGGPSPPPFREIEEKTDGGPPPPPFTKTKEKTGGGPPPPPFTGVKEKTGGGPPPPPFTGVKEKTGGGPPPPPFTGVKEKTGGGPLPPLFREPEGKQVEVHHHHRSKRQRRKQVEVHHHSCSERLWRKQVEVHYCGIIMPKSRERNIGALARTMSARWLMLLTREEDEEAGVVSVSRPHGRSSGDEVQVQGEQLAGSSRQPLTQGQQQSALGNREQAGMRCIQVAQGQQRTPGGSPRTSRNTVEHNMASAFPGLFKSGKGYTPYPKRRTASVRSTSIQFFLLDKCAERTPKSSDEMTLLQAGLGRRTVSIPEHADHSQISTILMDTYPKMAPLEGAWMLYKAAGGSGQRKLSILAPEAEGYTGAYIAKAFGGKGCLYIMPIQDTLDTSPLPYTSKEFEKMPKARCATCHLNMPIQLLALHTQECEPGSSADSRSFESTLEPDVVVIDVDSPALSSPVNTSRFVTPSTAVSQKMEVKVACPLCAKLFPEYSVEVHASTCGESTGREMDTTELNDDRHAVEELGGEDNQCNSLAKVIHTLQGRVDTTAIFNICVTREDLFTRGMGQWKRQKKSSPQNPLRVSFIGEPGVDNGALRKEFLTEMMTGIEAHLFQGGSAGKNPNYSITEYHKENFKTAGEIIAVCITQGGPPPNFFREWCFAYISTGEINKDLICKDDVTDPELRQLIEEVEMAEPEALNNLMDRILACGYSGLLTQDRKEEIIKAIILHSCLRILPMLQQISSGMQLYGLNEMIGQQPNTFRPLFVPGLLEKPDAEFLIGSLSPTLSDQGSLKRQRESKIVNFFQDFLQQIEDEEEENCFLKETMKTMQTECELEAGHGTEMEKPKITDIVQSYS
ncbi:uncharacterized protein LOC121653198 [Melanotaenia boesemani]|uniref:uncharacterized protein LOC121653198 n=1 Tax=Melanotaenia boesemani TaxID=1250792 RepID=UPI001C0486C5|nr:uncharacterized protein LOC121653198 [Melanotaenia boesemani]